jgi:hypothetical protein
VSEVALRFLALLAAALFAGGALYVSVVEHPARMRAGAAVAAAEFREMYRRAAPWQAGSAALALVAGVLAAVAGGEPAWAWGGGAVGLVIPYTLFAMMPVNRRLLDPAPLPEREARVLLAQWGRLHWIRSGLGSAGLAVLLWAAAR